MKTQIKNQFCLTRVTSMNRRRVKSNFFAIARWQLACLAGLLAVVKPAVPQTKLKLSTLKPGTERVQLINNGDFQFQGPLEGDNYPLPSGWNSSVDMYANAGSNMVAVNSGVVARAQVNSGAPATGFSQTVRLEPATTYYLIAYMWNMGDSSNHLNTTVDLNDAPFE